MLHIEQQCASFLLKPTFTLSSSAFFVHVLFGLPYFLWPSKSIFNAVLKTWPSSLLNTWPCQQVLLFIVSLFAIANRSIITFMPNMSIKSVYRHIFSIYMLKTTHCAHNRSFCPSENCHFTFFQTPCFTSMQHCWPYKTHMNRIFILRGHLVPHSNSPHSIVLTHQTMLTNFNKYLC